MTAPMKVVWDEVRPYIKENQSRYYYGIRAALIVGNGKLDHTSGKYNTKISDSKDGFLNQKI